MNEQVYNTLSVNGSGVPGEIRIFLNHIYEFKKGIRNMVLYTINKKYEGFAISRLEKQNICFLKQEVNAHKINLFFGKKRMSGCSEVHVESSSESFDSRRRLYFGSNVGI